jgi:hypothetical protein
MAGCLERRIDDRNEIEKMFQPCALGISHDEQKINPRIIIGGSTAAGSRLEVGWKAHEFSPKTSAERCLDGGPDVSIRMRPAFRSRRIDASKILLLMS